MKRDISNDDKNTIAVYDGVLYEYHDESWHEIESWSTDDELSNEQLVMKLDELKGEVLIARELFKNTNVLESIPKLIFYTSEQPRATPGDDAFIQRLISIPFCNENEEKDERKES